MAKHSLIWLTRPEADSTYFAAELSHAGIQSLIAPVMHMVPQPLATTPEKADAILLTSRNAAHVLAHLPSAWRALPVYCVGASTANAAVAHECTHIIPGTSDVMALLPRIAMDLGTGGRLHYFAGEDTRVDVVHLLGAHGVHVHTAIVYRAVAEHALGENIQTALAHGSVTGVAFFSPRSAEIACELMHAAKLTDATRSIGAFCFSLNVAKAAANLPWKNIHACHLPTRDAMRELIVSHTTKI